MIENLAYLNWLKDRGQQYVTSQTPPCLACSNRLRLSEFDASNHKKIIHLCYWPEDSENFQWLALFDKMVQAVGFLETSLQLFASLCPKHRSQEKTARSALDINASVLIIYGSALAAWVKPRDGQYVISTHHPAELIQSPELKRTAWSEMLKAKNLAEGKVVEQ